MRERLDWKAVAWDLERIFKKQFADPNKAPTLQVNQAFNSLHASDNELADARARLDETIAKQQARLERDRSNPSLPPAEPEHQSEQ